MRRILFVDDEPHVLDGLRNVLRKQRSRWDMSFALGGEAALEQMRQRPVDVIVSDMRMPGMDGAMLLERVMDEFPTVVRIILSGHAERASVLRALPVSHRFLAKPCGSDEIQLAIERACAALAALENVNLRRVVGQFDRLPSPPMVYQELTRAVADPDVPTAKIVAILEKDPGVCAKLLQLVNSSYFGIGHRVAGVEAAVSYLGVELVRSLALSEHLLSVDSDAPRIPGFSVERVRSHSLLIANVAKRLVSSPHEQEDAFTAGLLHDIGLLLIANRMPDEMKQIVAAVQREGVPMHLKEKEILGITHADAGAYLLGLWGLPSSIVAAVARHHDEAPPPDGAFDTAVVVHVADALVGHSQNATSGVTMKIDLEPAYLAMPVVARHLAAWTEMAAAEARRCGSAS